MLLNSIRAKLELMNQMHLLRFWNQLSAPEQAALATQIASLDMRLFKKQSKLLEQDHARQRIITPPPISEHSGQTLLESAGKQLLAEGAVGCIIAAGGQGTRLAFPHPKGLFPVTRFKHKTLFQLFAEKCLAAGKYARQELPLAIMTSCDNHEETEAYWKKQNYFGLRAGQVYFFQQAEMPLLDENGGLFLDRADHIASGPTGNGDVLRHFMESGLGSAWRERGVRYLNFIPVDNALADPFDVELAAWHAVKEHEISVKAIIRQDPHEKVGLLAREAERLTCVEYSEIDSKEFLDLEDNGQLKYALANISCFCFDIDFAQKAAKIDLPWHLAHKTAIYLDKEGQTIISPEPKAWKFERFIFDLLAHTSRSGILIYPRETCFAPLKNTTGADSIESVQEALLEHELALIAKISKLKPTATKIELSQQFYYPTQALQEFWQGRLCQKNGYISEAIETLRNR